MQHQQTNKDLPANPVQFMDKFSNQMIILAGFTKQEAVALEIFKVILSNEIDNIENSEERNYIIEVSYSLAEDFLKHLEK